MTDTLSKHRDLQREKKEKIMKEIEYYKQVRLRNLLMIKQLQEEADRYEKLYCEAIDKLREIDR